MKTKSESEINPNRESAMHNVEEMTAQAQEQGKPIAQTIDSVAQTVQDTFRRTKSSARAAIGTVAEGIDTSAEYFSRRGMEGVIDDTETLIRRHPFQALMIGLSMGYLLARSRQP